MAKPVEVTSNDDYWFIKKANGFILQQRKRPLRVYDNPMDGYEEIIVELCEALQKAEQENHELREALGKAGLLINNHSH